MKTSIVNALNRAADLTVHLFVKVYRSEALDKLHRKTD